jgi:hypothetical protein
MLMNVVDAISDQNLLGQWFAGPSWDSWRAVLKGAFALPMTPEEFVVFGELAGGRAPPGKRVRELWIVAGRRAGKDSIASAIAAWAAAGTDYRPLLRPGEAATVMCLAVDRDQAKIVSRYARAYFHHNKMLAPLVVNETANTIALETGAELTVTTNSFRGLRGRSVACAVLDEIAFWRSEDSANPDMEVYQALMPGLATLPDAMLVGISSPYRRGGLLYRKWREHFGKDGDDVLVIHAPSRKLNPTLKQKVVDDALEEDSAAARAEWLAEWRDDVLTFVNREVVEASVTSGVLVRPPLRSQWYVGFVDPSGGSSDSFTCGIAHREGPRVVLDLIAERRPPFNPDAVVREFSETLKCYRISRVVGDRYAAGWPPEAFRKQGIVYEPSDKVKSEIYLTCLPLLNSGLVDLLDDKRLIAQLCGLERRTARGGRDSIDHAPGAHDDVANSCCGALVRAMAKAPMRIHPSVVERAGWPARPPLIAW